MLFLGTKLRRTNKKVQLLRKTILGCENCAFYVEVKQNKEDMEEKKLTYEELEHYYNSTVGLWAIDRNPQEVSLNWIVENAFQLGIEEKHSNSENIRKNLKPFDLQSAKAGNPVCTRDRRKARIIAFDTENSSHPIVALVKTDYVEKPYSYSEKGEFQYDGVENELDLMMLPEKKEGYVNIFKNPNTNSYYTSAGLFDNKEKAEMVKDGNKIATVKLTWEE